MASKASLHSQLSLSSCLYFSSIAPCALHSLGGKYGYRQRLFGITPLRLCHHSALVSSLLRRLFLPSVSGIWDALRGRNSASIAVRRGMQLFRQGRVYDIDLIELISDIVTIPVVASTGAAQSSTSLKVFQKTSAFAALAAGIFHRKKVPILSVKEHLSKEGIEVRM